MKYSNTYRILSVVCDNTDHLHLWGLARLFQECAEEHTNLTHIGFDDLKQRNQAWILSRMLYRIHRMPAFGEQVTVTTWSRGCDGLFAFREFTMTDAAGQLLAAASSYWAVIDFTSRRAVRIHDMMGNYEHHPESATGELTINKLRLPKNIMSTSGALTQTATTGVEIGESQVLQFAVPRSALDHTNHVNNSEYLRWAYDAMQTDCAISEVEINYLLESRLGENITVQTHKPSAAEQWVEIRNPRGASAMLRIQF